MEKLLEILGYIIVFQVLILAVPGCIIFYVSLMNRIGDFLEWFTTGRWPSHDKKEVVPAYKPGPLMCKLYALDKKLMKIKPGKYFLPIGLSFIVTCIIAAIVLNLL